MNCRVAALLCAVSATATGCFVPDDATARVQMGSGMRRLSRRIIVVRFAGRFTHRSHRSLSRGIIPQGPVKPVVGSGSRCSLLLS